MVVLKNFISAQFPNLETIQGRVLYDSTLNVLRYNDSVTYNNLLVSKDISNNLSDINNFDLGNNLTISGHNGIDTGLILNNTLVTSTGTQLNYTNVTQGVGTASKALVLDSNRYIENINNLSVSTLIADNINLTTAGQLALVLGFEPQRYEFGALDASTSGITSLAPFNINQLRSAFELGIEILDIPLKTYFAQTQNSQFAGAGGRQNVICYFTPIPSTETQGLYSFANAVHQWLEIDNKSSTYLHSLSFRIFNPYSGLSFISNSMGFNLLISEPETRGLTIGL